MSKKQASSFFLYTTVNNFRNNFNTFETDHPYILSNCKKMKVHYQNVAYGTQ